MSEIWGYLVIIIGCPLLGGLPLIDWIFYALNGRQLKQLGTGNISVSAAFYHGGQLTGILAVLSEAGKGIIAVLLARYFFSQGTQTWELIALIGLVIGRYILAKGAGTTNVVWGIVVHDFISAVLIFVISGVAFTIIRDKTTGKFTALFLLGWVIPPGDEPQNLIDNLQPSPDFPLVVRSSAIGEDGELASGAGQYLSILNVTNKEFLKIAIVDCLASYQKGSAANYRIDQEVSDTGMAILVQKQIQGIFSGVAFSRNPVNQLEDCILIEALPGDATQVVSGKFTPQQYKVFITETEIFIDTQDNNESQRKIIQEVAKIARELEQLYQGIPQDIEWTYDGETLWLLQTRPITNLYPIWTRKIAAEVIPGFIRPLTWSINKPLTCGVWGEIFSLVLGERSQGLNFDETATLHYHRAYFNATLLGQIFLKMGLPPESLEFLTRGAKFSKPPLKTTLINLKGLIKLLFRELNLEKDFTQDYKNNFIPILKEIKDCPPEKLSNEELLTRVEKILSVLKKGTYYSILAPLSFAIRQGIFKIPDIDLDNSTLPEIECLKSLGKIAKEARNLIPINEIADYNCASLFTYLAENPEGEGILKQLDNWLDKYGYLGDVATDISIPRWRDDPRHVRQIFTEFLLREITQFSKGNKSNNWKTSQVQSQLNLKGRVTKIYSQLLANLRWTLLALEKSWLANGILIEIGDIFFLELSEIINLIQDNDINNLQNIIQNRKLQLQQSQEITNIPSVVYGNPILNPIDISQPLISQRRFQGIGASAGIVEGKVKILRSLESNVTIDKNTVLVVNYTDSGWTTVLSRAGGIIAEVGGRLSHGAIIAREYHIPAVMDIENATNLLQDGQWVRIDGQNGVVEVIDK